MHIQGRIHSAHTAISPQGPPGDGAVQQHTDGMVAGSGIPDNKSGEQQESRSELLSNIRKKIAAGFYNSDSVMEDIGYGFAQALNNTL